VHYIWGKSDTARGKSDTGVSLSDTPVSLLPRAVSLLPHCRQSVKHSMIVMFYRHNMVRSYVRKSNRAQYSEHDIVTAIIEIRRGDMSTKRASVVFNINRTTLIKHMKKSGSCPENLGRFKEVFTLDMECELVMHIVNMQQNFDGLSLSLIYAH